MASIAAAVGTGASVVQLVDTAARLLKATTTFIAAVAEASKELDLLHRKIQQLEKLFDRTRAIACSYQNSNLALSTQNQETLGLLSEALVVCSSDLQALQDEVQKPVEESKSSAVRLKRRLKHAFDEKRLAKLSLRLEGDMAFINGLLSCLTMSNDAVIYGSNEHISNVVGILPSIGAKLAELSIDNGTNFVRIRSEVGKILEELQKVDNKLSFGDGGIAQRPSPIDRQPRLSSVESPLVESPSLLRALANHFADGEAVLQSLELLGPIARNVLPEFYLKQNLKLSKESYAWIMSDLQKLLGAIHLAVSQAHLDTLVRRPSDPHANSLVLNIPKRFRHRAIGDYHREEDASSEKTKDIALSAASAIVLSKASGYSDLHHPHHFSGPTGDLYSSFDGESISSAHFQQFIRVALCFVPHKKYALPGIAFACCKFSRDKEVGSDAVITVFDVIPSRAPIIREIRSGDLGVSQVLKRLKAGEIWAGDRDDSGRSLLSHAIESGSRDMIALFARMGADPQDIHSLKEMDFATVRHIFV